MGGRDKLFAPLGERPLLACTVAAFEAAAGIHRIALVLSEANLEQGRGLVEAEGFRKVVAICLGGARRRDSVRAGLAALGRCDWVAVHDGARPLVTPDLIERGLVAARATGAAVPVLPLVDTIKEVDENGRVVATVPRQRLRAAQTPQVFRYDLLWQAHTVIDQAVDATDDAAMVESLGYTVTVFPGSQRNLKVTTPDDLLLAEALLSVSGRAGEQRLRRKSASLHPSGF